MRSSLIGALLLLVAAGAGAELTVETVADDLNYPWSLAFLPDGTILVTEKPGALRIIRGGVLDERTVDGVPDVYYAGQGGLFDVLPARNFAATRRLYLSYAHGDRSANATRVIAATFDGSALSDPEVIFTATPSKDTPHHYGGRMALLPDDTLLLTIGDGFNYRESAQRLDSHLGKLVRIAPDGSVPTNNPFVGERAALPEIWSYGHRNAQGIVVVPDSGNVYLHEHGPRGGDELNRVAPGANYGWPIATQGIDYSGARISPFVDYPGTESPLVDWTPSIAPAGMAYYDGALFPNWRGDLFVAALAEKSLRRLDLVDGRVVDQEILLAELNERLRDVRTGPDGALYVLTDSASGRLLRITPAVDP